MAFARWKFAVAIVVAGLSPIATAAGIGSLSSAGDDGPGICDRLGCNAGQGKCADGTITYPDGIKIDYTCYSKPAT